MPPFAELFFITQCIVQATIKSELDGGCQRLCVCVMIEKAALLHDRPGSIGLDSWTAFF